MEEREIHMKNMASSSYRQTALKEPYYYKSREHFFTIHATTTRCGYKKGDEHQFGVHDTEEGGYETHNAQCGKDYF
jgi:hypothetical protein